MRQVSLAMYPFPHLREAYGSLWSAVVRQLGSAWPSRLTWTDDVTGLWASPDMLVAQTCGWPLVTALAGRVRVVGAFAYDVAGAQDARYRSAIVTTRRSVTIEDLAGATVAVNNPDSLSGWVSLRHALPGHGDVVWTGSHRESLRALCEGRASAASIDAVSFAHVADSEPTLVAGLRLVGRGPLVASLPLICPADLPDAEHEALRVALGTAIADEAMSEVCRTLHIGGFEPLDFADYAQIAELDPELFAAQRGPRSPA